MEVPPSTPLWIAKGSTRDTHFVYENGWWRHHLTENEKHIFGPDLSYVQFVETQQ